MGSILTAEIYIEYGDVDNILTEAKIVNYESFNVQYNEFGKILTIVNVVPKDNIGKTPYEQVMDFILNNNGKVSNVNICEDGVVIRTFSLVKDPNVSLVYVPISASPDAVKRYLENFRTILLE